MQEERNPKYASNLTEYIENLKEMGNIILFVWKVLTSQKAKELMSAIIILQIISCVFFALQPICLSKAMMGVDPTFKIEEHWYSKRLTPYLENIKEEWLTKQITRLLKVENSSIVLLRLAWITTGILLLLATKKIVVFLAYLQAKRREHLLAENVGTIDRKTLSMFLEKSLGIHNAEDNELTEPNMKKGREKVFHLQNLMLFEGIDVLMTTFVSFVAIWILYPTAGFIMTLIILGYLIHGLYLNHEVVRVCTPIEALWRAKNRYLVERMIQVERVKINCKEAEEVEEINRQHDFVMLLDVNYWIGYNRQTSLRRIVIYDVMVFITGYGLWEVLTGNLVLSSLYPMLDWLSQITGNLWRVTNIEHQFNLAAPPIISLKNAWELPIGIKITENPVKIADGDDNYRIELQNVSLKYKKEKDGGTDNPPVLEEISFVIEPHEKVALIGPSGAGKTTIGKLLLRAMDPDSGVITIGRKPLDSLDLKSYLSGVGYVPQQAQIMSGTVKYNLLYGMEERERNKISDDEIWELMRLLQIDFGERLVNGLETKVGYRGIKLSGGQAQRLMIGAAVIKKPKFMLIDEATSSLDPTTEKLVQRGLEMALGRSLSALIITHRLPTVRRLCNKFVMLDRKEGRPASTIVAIASSFEELAEKSPAFKKLAEDQDIII